MSSKIYITGTTRGLGKSLAMAYRRMFCREEIVALNRPEYNLGVDIDAYVKTDFGIYVNNAHHDYDQVELLYRLFEANKDRRCVIVNIGSCSADGDRKVINRYAIQKKALDAACTQLQLVDSRCIVMQFKLGRMDTDMTAHIDKPKMNPDKIALTISDLSFHQASPDSYVKTFTLDSKYE